MAFGKLMGCAGAFFVVAAGCAIGAPEVGDQQQDMSDPADDDGTTDDTNDDDDDEDAPQQCGGSLDVACPKGEYCETLAGACGEIGECTPLGSPTCPDVYDPVCGCDGVTYGNTCEAEAAGASIDHEGTCEALCGGILGVECEGGDYCSFDEGVCGDGDQQGVCQPIPGACPDNVAPVCGCNDVTYGNACEAAMAGMSVRHTGPCEKVCGGIIAAGCDPGDYCLFENGTCGDGDQQGLCHDIPTACPDNVAPVCGCDSVTYGNACEAAMAGMSVRYTGFCLSVDDE